jgi:hypothetical protein
MDLQSILVQLDHKVFLVYRVLQAQRDLLVHRVLLDQQLIRVPLDPQGCVEPMAFQ